MRGSQNALMCSAILGTARASPCGAKALAIWLAIMTRRSSGVVWISLIALPYSAATSGLMRRVSREKRSYSSWYSVGPLEARTSTAVTLYSGQLVAQSEKSVVMTLACVIGWWKVV